MQHIHRHSCIRHLIPEEISLAGPLIADSEIDARQCIMMAAQDTLEFPHLVENALPYLLPRLIVAKSEAECLELSEAVARATDL